jgi:hypothetical protein
MANAKERRLTSVISRPTSIDEIDHRSPNRPKPIPRKPTTIFQL